MREVAKEQTRYRESDQGERLGGRAGAEAEQEQNRRGRERKGKETVLGCDSVPAGFPRFLI